MEDETEEEGNTGVPQLGCVGRAVDGVHNGKARCQGNGCPKMRLKMKEEWESLKKGKCESKGRS